MNSPAFQNRLAIELLYAANAQSRNLERARNQARTALVNDVAMLMMNPNSPSNFLKLMNDRICDLEQAIEADTEAAMVSRALATVIIATSQNAHTR